MALLVAGAAAGIALLLSCGGGPAISSANGGGSGTSSGGTCGACSIPSTLHTLTADTDPAQLAGGYVGCQSGSPVPATKIVDGPFVITDVAVPEFGAVGLFTVAKGASCDIGGNTFAYIGPAWGTSNGPLGNRPSISGARLLVNANETLCTLVSCSQGAPSLRWSGFRPYGS